VSDDPYCAPLTRLLARDGHGSAEVRALVPVLFRLAARAALDLRSPALIEDVVSTVFELLLRPTVRAFDPARGTATQFLYGYVLRAIAEVRSSHGAAAVKKQELRRQLHQDVRLVADDRQHGPWVLPDPMIAVDSRLDLARATAGQPVPLRLAVWLIAEADPPLSKLAEAVGWDRTTLRRRLRAWADGLPGLDGLR
jgi:DNA-directed RNA polymerase specialized sigma24 family protein